MVVVTISPSVNSESSFLSIIQEVQLEATKITGLHPYLSRHNQSRFLTDLTIVALSVRYAIFLRIWPLIILNTGQDWISC